MGAAGQELSEDERKKYGSTIHWGLGVGAGAVYGALRDRVPGADWGNGLLFGTTFWALIDEGANTALGLTPGPSRFPWQTHARGLAGHLVFGLAADTALRLMDRGMRRAPMRANYRAGVIASLTAEAVFTATMMRLLHLRGKDPWKVTRASASLVFGPRSLGRRASRPEMLGDCAMDLMI